MTSKGAGAALQRRTRLMARQAVMTTHRAVVDSANVSVLLLQKIGVGAFIVGVGLSAWGNLAPC
jgi:hypothetical protein